MSDDSCNPLTIFPFNLFFPVKWHQWYRQHINQSSPSIYFHSIRILPPNVLTGDDGMDVRRLPETIHLDNHLTRFSHQTSFKPSFSRYLSTSVTSDGSLSVVRKIIVTAKTDNIYNCPIASRQLSNSSSNNLIRGPPP